MRVPQKAFALCVFQKDQHLDNHINLGIYPRFSLLSCYSISQREFMGVVQMIKKKKTATDSFLYFENAALRTSQILFCNTFSNSFLRHVNFYLHTDLITLLHILLSRTSGNWHHKATLYNAIPYAGPPYCETTELIAHLPGADRLH